MLGSSSASAIYAAVASSQDDSNGAAFQLSASVGQAYYLVQSNDAITVTSDDSVSFTVSWPAALVTREDGTSSRAASGVRYIVYAFATEQGTGDAVATTGCGLAAFGDAPDTEGSTGKVVQEAPQRDATSLVIGGLDAHTEYQIAVAAVCDDACWSATLSDEVDELLRQDGETAHPGRQLSSDQR